MSASDAERTRLDDAARAGWLYFIAGNTQDEIARKLNISRPTAQRLVSLAISERLITFRLDHPIAACMELAARLTERYGLAHCQIVPTDPESDSSVLGIAEAAAAFLEQQLRGSEPIVVGIGTGRTLRAAVEQIPRMNCQHHRLVSLVGHISMEGSASFFDVLARLSDLVHAPHYPMPLPVVVPSRSERDQLIRLEPVRRLRELAATADVTLVGVGRMDTDAPLHIDGFISSAELSEMRQPRRGRRGHRLGLRRRRRNPRGRHQRPAHQRPAHRAGGQSGGRRGDGNQQGLADSRCAPRPHPQRSRHRRGHGQDAAQYRLSRFLAASVATQHGANVQSDSNVAANLVRLDGNRTLLCGNELPLTVLAPCIEHMISAVANAQSTSGRII